MAVVGFIGTGNMGGALARAAAKSPLCGKLLLANRSPEKAKKLCDELGRKGGFILSEGKMLSFRNDCRSDNLKAICDFVSGYKMY